MSGVIRETAIYAATLAGVGLAVYFGTQAVASTDEQGTREALENIGMELISVDGQATPGQCWSLSATRFTAEMTSGHILTGTACKWPRKPVFLAFDNNPWVTKP